MDDNGNKDRFIPKWLQRLIAREGEGTHGSSKHARAKRKPRTWRLARRRRRKARRLARRMHRGAAA